MHGQETELPCFGIPGISSNVRVRSDGLQNAYDSTRASNPILHGKVRTNRVSLGRVVVFTSNKHLKKQHGIGNALHILHSVTG